MTVPIEPISVTGSARGPSTQLPDPQPVDFSQWGSGNSNGATNNGGAFAAFTPPPAAPANAARVEFAAVQSTVTDALRNGVVKPHLKEMQTLLENAVSSGQPVPTEELMLVSMKIQEGSAVTAFLTQAVNSTRQSLQTLIERS